MLAISIHFPVFVPIFFFVSISSSFFPTRHRRGVGLSDVFLLGVHFAHLSLRFLLLLQPRLVKKTVKNGQNEETNQKYKSRDKMRIDLKLKIDFQNRERQNPMIWYKNDDWFKHQSFTLQPHLELLLYTKNFRLLGTTKVATHSFRYV